MMRTLTCWRTTTLITNARRLCPRSSLTASKRMPTQPPAPPKHPAATLPMRYHARLSFTCHCVPTRRKSSHAGESHGQHTQYIRVLGRVDNRSHPCLLVPLPSAVQCVVLVMRM
jgi:hypothetical protein